MFRNYLKTAFRNLAKNKVFTLINIFGLSFGIACFTFISFWVWDELRMDRFHTNDDQIYQMFGEINQSGESIIRPYIPSAMVEPMLSQLPEIGKITRTFPSEAVFATDKVRFSESGLYVDSTFLGIFNFPLKEGKPEGVFNDANAVVISSVLAEKYFPGESALGKQIDIVQKEKRSYIITGVLEDIPKFSSLQFDFLMAYDKFEKEFRPWWGKSNKWSFTNYNTTGYVRINTGTNIDGFEQKLNGLFDNYKIEKSDDQLFLYPFTEVYLHSDFSEGKIPTGKIKYVKLLFLIALIVLLIACINFINLSTAIANKRAKEVGLRKTVGASKRQIILQLLIESILITTFSMVIAIACVEMLMPAFNLLTQKSIIVPFSSSAFILILIVSSLIIGLLAGGYPAFILSSFEASQAVKSNNESTGGLKRARKGLVIIQFSLSIIFIVFTIVISNQIDFIKNTALGMRKENVIHHPLHGIKDKKEAYKKELMTVPGVQSVSFTEGDPFNTDNENAGVFWSGKPENTDLYFNVIQVDESFLETFEIKLIEGRSFINEQPSETGKFIINQAAAQAMMVDQPLGMDLTVWGQSGKVIGIVNDYHHQPLAQRIEPVIIKYNPEGTFDAYISFEDNRRKEIINSIRAIYSKYESDYIFDYSFVDDQYNISNSDVITAGKLSSIFAIMAIMISCLGLFGLSAFITEQRSKETGIRKVLGATEMSLLFLFSSGFIKLVVISFVIAAPIAWLCSQYWLANYAYHIQMGLIPFIVAGFSAICIALMTVSYNTLKAAFANPVNVLKD